MCFVFNLSECPKLFFGVGLSTAWIIVSVLVVLFN